jgi:hypothetical protein
MTISELNELSSKIQEFLNSQKVVMVKNCGVVKEQIRLQESLIPLPFKELTPDKLEQLGLKVREILFSHDMKFIKNRSAENIDLKYQKTLKSHVSTKFSPKPETSKPLFRSIVITTF